MRRIPVYVLVDVSNEMIDDPINVIEKTVQILINTLRAEPITLETAYLSIITFGNSAQQLVPLTDLISIPEITLKAGGNRVLGAALELLSKKIDEDLGFPTSEYKGNWRPRVFILIGGSPTDNIIKGAYELRNKDIEIVCCATGFDAPIDVLNQITDNVVQFSSFSQSYIAAFFKFVGQMVT